MQPCELVYNNANRTELVFPKSFRLQNVRLDYEDVML